MMKYFVVALAVLVVVSSSPISKDERKRLLKECVAESGVNEETLKQAIAGHFVEDEKLESFAFCVFKKAGVISDDGEIKTDIAKSQLPEDFSEADKNAFVSDCLQKKGTSPRRTAYLVYKCFRELSPVKN